MDIDAALCKIGQLAAPAWRKKTAALAKTYLDDVLGHLDVDAAAAADDDDDDDDSNKYYFLLYLRLFFDTSDSNNNNNKMMMMKMLVMSLLTHSDCPCLPLTTRRESSQLNPKNTEHDFKPHISKMTNWYQKKMTWNSFSLATVNLVKTNNCLNMMINSIAGISEYPRVTELQSYYGTLRTYAQGPSMFLFPYILLTNKFPATFCQVVRAYLLFRWSRKMRWLREKHRPRFAKNQANPAPSRRNPPARSID